MTQLKQAQKVKLFHILKVVFYLLGLPLFFIAVFFTAIKFIGVEPFVGLSTSSFASGVFVGYERFITSPALYGIWCAFAIWAFISICHIVLAKFVKSSKLRMFAIVALILVVMLGTMGIMDAAFEAQIGKIADGAPDGVSVLSYKDQLSYYDYVSYGRKEKSIIYTLTKDVARYEDVYNIKWQGIDKSGEAGNIANKPVTYANIIDDEGNQGATPESANLSADTLVEKEPDRNGKLVIGGKTYSNYYYIHRTGSDGTECYVWYSLDLIPAGYEWNAKKGKMTFKQQDGIYGKGLYNPNGMLSDGWVFSFENMLEILEDYYAGQEYLAAHSSKEDVAKINQLKADAVEEKEKYYSDPETDAFLRTRYGQEADFAKNFSLDGRLDTVIAELGALLGDNALFDWLLADDKAAQALPILSGVVGGMIPIPGIGDVIGTWFVQLKDTGATMSALLETLNLGDLAPTFMKAVETAHNTEHPEDIITVNDVFMRLVYQAEEHEGLYLEIRKDDAEGALLADAVIDRSMDLGNVGPFLNTLLDGLVEQLGLKQVLDLVGGLAFQDVTIDNVKYKGIAIAGTTVPLLNAETGKFAIDVTKILEGVLSGLYSYQSPVIKPYWEFYTQAVEANTPEADKDVNSANYAKYKADLEMARYLADYDRANYEATVYGSMIGSTLVGDTLGAGTYPAALGLTDLASVQQLKTDLSYQPKNFPLYAFRDMLLTFAGIVMLFYFLSFVAAEKERKYACSAACEGKACDCNGETECTSGTETDAEAPAKTNKVTETVEKVRKLATTTSKQATLGRKITTYVLYALAFLPLLIIGIVVAAKSAAILPQYGAMHFIGFIILLVLAIVYAVVVILLTRKASKSSATSKTVRIGITYVCLTAVLALILTYVLPDAVAKATSSTLWVEDMYNDPIAQVEENAALEHDYVRNNLLGGNLNIYDADGTLTKDFSYYGLKQRSKGKYLNEDIQASVTKYSAYKGAKFDELLGTLDEKHLTLYNYIYNNYVLRDPYYAYSGDSSDILARRAVTLAITDYLFANGYEGYLNRGLKDAKLSQLFANNYDSFNQDGYKPLDDSLLLYAQLDGRMTVPVIVRLILNKGWMYSQPNTETVDGQQPQVYYDEAHSFLYEMYDPETLAAYIEDGGKFDDEHKEKLIGGDGKSYEVRYGINKDGWKVYENGVVRRPVKWLVLDMLGTPMDLASLDISEYQNLIKTLAQFNVFDMLSNFLGEDVKGLVGALTDGAGLNLSVYLTDAGELAIQLLPMSTEYAMLGYMQSTWIQSNGLLMAVINVMALRNYLYIFAGIGLFLILLAGVLVDIEKKYGTAPEGANAEGESKPEEGEKPEDENKLEDGEKPEEGNATDAVGELTEA